MIMLQPAGNGMNDQDKSREQLIEELAELRQRLATVEPAPDWRRQLEEALNQREERFRSLIEHSYGAIVLIDASGNFTYTSPSIHRILGYQAEELLGTYGFDLVHPDDVNTALLKFTGILQGRRV
jgi:PAS domain-containing protein